MSDPLDLDLLRAAASGGLPPDERAALDARLRADADLAALAGDLGAVLGAPEEALPACPLAFDALALDGDPVRDAGPAARSTRRVALPVALLAASVLVGVGLLFFLRGEGAGSRRGPLGPVTLAAIPLTPLPDEAVLPVPAALADYAPAGAAGLRFLEGLDAGKAVARATGRPLVLFGYNPDCPLCRELGRSTFKAPSVSSHAEPFVLARAQVESLGADVLAGVDVGWPIFLVYGPDGRRVDAFGGAPDARAFAARLDGLAATHPAPAPPLAWAGTQAVAKDLVAADAAAAPAERAPLVARALEVAKGTPLEPLALSRSRVIAREAQRALFSARDAATAGRTEEALSTLDAALGRFRSTPYERDLGAVRERTARDRAFPALEAVR